MLLPTTVDAAHNPNLSVSVENQRFNNHFAGSMVVEVVVHEPNISKLDEGVGEPDVTLNGKRLRMVQSNDGNWYAYFANKDKALEADKIAFNGGNGKDGEGLDFGVFCGPQTTASVLGVSFSATEGIAISSDLTGSTDGGSSLTACTGTPSGNSKMNVLRNAKGLNQNSQVQVGQIGIKADIWPVIQLFSFGSNVEIKYNRAGGTQSVKLSYDDIENISITLDRDNYPTNADVFATIYDMQLNQDPTDQDSWTFSVGTTQRTFYFAFTGSGANAANNGKGLINIVSSLSSLGFENNGKLTVSLGSIGELKTNNIQPSSTITDGTTTFSNIVTFVETSPNSGIFTNSDYSGKSNLKISSSAPRGQSATMTYNDKSVSIVSGSATASLALDSDASLKVSTLLPGKRAAVTLIDNDLNIRSATKDDLHVYDSTAIIPSIQIGSPVTLEKASEVKFFETSTTALTSSGISSITSSVNDKNSDILIINTKNAGTSNFEKISINLGITANTLQSLLIDASASDSDGTNWINYDLRSFERQLAVSDFSDTTMTLYFGSLDDTTPVQILDKGDISSARGFVQMDNDDVVSIKSKSGTVFLVINFDSSGNTDGAGRIASETDTQPIVFDIFSLGEVNSSPVNNAIYRLELKETQANSGTFVGSVELTQSNQFDSAFVKNTVTTISDNVRLLINQRLLDEKGIDLKYSDIASAGFNFDISSQQNVPTSTGKVTLNAQTFRFGQPVTVTLIDPDLNQKHDTREIYLTSNDPNSDNVDAVVDSGGNLLLEILLKDIRYKRCTINGVEKGGLASTGFTLVETGTATGVFEGIFRMPTQICNKDGTRLISTAGGSVDVKYHDARDASGNPNIFGLTFFKNIEQAPPKVPERKIPSWIKNSADSWADKKIDDNTFATSIQYMINQKIILASTEKSTIKYGSVIPNWIRNNAGWWANGQISEDDFVNAIEYLVDQGIIKVP